MRLRSLSMVVCLLVAPLFAVAADVTPPSGPAAYGLPEEVLPALDVDAPTSVCLADAAEQLFVAAAGPQLLACQHRCSTAATCPLPPPNCIVGCANRCCIYACEQ